MNDRIFGVVIRKPAWDKGREDWYRDEEGDMLFFPFARTIEHDGIKDYSLFRNELRTPGLECLRDGQVVSFDAEGRIARDIERVPVRESKRWKDTVHAIQSLNGGSGFVAAEVVHFNPERGFGFAAPKANPSSKIFFHVKRVIRRDPSDFIGFFEKDEVFIRPEGRSRDEHSTPAAEEVVVLED
ncbi:MAG: hypothetical protein Q7S09_02025 [bacterium]|nr:hypothetical protein [bacterium]